MVLSDTGKLMLLAMDNAGAATSQSDAYTKLKVGVTKQPL